jgi:hypothetical protein
MAPITVTTEVNRSAGDVFSYATDRTHFSELQNGVEGYIEAAPTGSGRNGSQRGESAWPIAPSAAEVTAFDPPNTWSVRPRLRRLH